MSIQTVVKRVLQFLITFLPVIATQAQNSGFSWKDTYGKSPTAFTVADWQSVIDATWGDGADTDEKLAIFDSWWDEIDNRFGAFHDLDVNIDTLRARYRPQIEAGVSHGRFSGIMTHFTYQLQELHTYLFDPSVRNTAMTKGVPQMVIGQFGTNARFGALLTPLEDSTLVVYEVLPNHPLGLEPGDVVLGYDGVQWKDIYPRLLEAELPLFLNPVHASTEEGNYYYAMHAAGLNWHLFDTIDVVKYSSGDTLHFETNLLNNENRAIWGKEQIAPPGVAWPNRFANSRVGWGIIEETNIGLITVTSWSFDAVFDIRAKFEQAVAEMVFTHEADGIIFDFRFNTGGGALAREGLQILFNTTVPTIGFDQRVFGSDDRLSMEPDPLRLETNLVIRGWASTFYDGPIAVLIGPGAISAGELEARRMSFHPNARIFGLPAAGGNTGSDFIQISDPSWFVSRGHSAQYLASNHEYITRTALQPDERIWFERDDVAQGIDTVIKAAMSWIASDPTSNEASPDQVSLGLNVDQYPNPFGRHATLAFNLHAPTDVRIAVYDMLGRKVVGLLDTSLHSGRHEVMWDGHDQSGNPVAAGTYFWRITAGDQVATGKVAILR